MSSNITLTDRGGNILKKGDFTEPEIRMAAKAGYRVFRDEMEITQELINLYKAKHGEGESKI